ncbi:hypothetical protein EVAR_46718_1 [Eumeta japonica]|uniref:Uncharacterized protein n=1 Tax=Eumeta variegata TaxID=151549 RepID=A0A4C1XBP1_EUMVA|nr:hypothetical protein EVAR_46718_1 [Eumeta japonica]
MLHRLDPEPQGPRTAALTRFIRHLCTTMPGQGRTNEVARLLRSTRCHTTGSLASLQALVMDRLPIIAARRTPALGLSAPHSAACTYLRHDRRGSEYIWKCSPYDSEGAVADGAVGLHVLWNGRRLVVGRRRRQDGALCACRRSALHQRHGHAHRDARGPRRAAHRRHPRARPRPSPRRTAPGRASHHTRTVTPRVSPAAYTTTTAARNHRFIIHARTAARARTPHRSRSPLHRRTPRSGTRARPSAPESPASRSPAPTWTKDGKRSVTRHTHTHTGRESNETEGEATRSPRVRRHDTMAATYRTAALRVAWFIETSATNHCS